MEPQSWIDWVLFSAINLHPTESCNDSSPKRIVVEYVQKYEDLLVLSLGTGKSTVRYSAKTAAKWGTLSWIYNKGNVPILDMLLLASQDIVDYNMSNTFYEQCSHDNYLRIQVSVNTAYPHVDPSSLQSQIELIGSNWWKVKPS